MTYGFQMALPSVSDLISETNHAQNVCLTQGFFYTLENINERMQSTNADDESCPSRLFDEVRQSEFMFHLSAMFWSQVLIAVLKCAYIDQKCDACQTCRLHLMNAIVSKSFEEQPLILASIQLLPLSLQDTEDASSTSNLHHLSVQYKHSYV